MITAYIDMTEIYEEAMEETELFGYFICIRLLDHGIPVKIDPLNIRWHQIEVTCGKLTLDTPSLTDYIFEWNNI